MSIIEDTSYQEILQELFNTQTLTIHEHAYNNYESLSSPVYKDIILPLYKLYISKKALGCTRVIKSAIVENIGTYNMNTHKDELQPILLVGLASNISTTSKPFIIPYYMKNVALTINLENNVVLFQDSSSHTKSNHYIKNLMYVMGQNRVIKNKTTISLLENSIYEPIDQIYYNLKIGNSLEYIKDRVDSSNLGKVKDIINWHTELLNIPNESKSIIKELNTQIQMLRRLLNDYITKRIDNQQSRESIEAITNQFETYYTKVITYLNQQ